MEQGQEGICAALHRGPVFLYLGQEASVFYSLRPLAGGSLFERLIAQRQLRGDLFKDLRCKCCKLSSRHASGRGRKGLGNLLRDVIGQFRQAGEALGDGRGLPRGDLPSRAAFIGASWVLMERASSPHHRMEAVATSSAVDLLDATGTSAGR